jgi:hypothetical protein
VDGTPSPTFAGDERRRHGEKQRGRREMEVMAKL